ncbi:MAG: hypothetical protein JO325_00325, partial [Solirubrobacterales bacterium]|nr:hypothetical protein [Solirubrobacterales bacterium]
MGDRLRLFDRVALRGGKGGRLGNNGSVVTLEAIEAEGLVLRNAKGATGFVPYDALRDKDNGRVRLAYGDVVTLDAIQSATSTEHIHAMPSGSAAVNSFKNYVGLSRARETSWLVVSDGAERSEVLGRRALGNVEPVTETDVWANVARNLSRQPAKALATELLKTAHDVNIGQVRGMADAFQPAQQRAAEKGRAPGASPETAAARAAQRQAIAARKPPKRLTGQRHADQEARRERRVMRPVAARPKTAKAPELPRVTTPEVEASFREALSAAGLRPEGAIHMDGKRHFTKVDGSKSKRGFYVAYLDGAVPHGGIVNHKTGVRVDWKPDGASRTNAADMWAERERVAAARREREAEAKRQEQRAAQVAAARWSKAKPVTSHPYLRKKGVEAHGLREDRHG